MTALCEAYQLLNVHSGDLSTAELNVFRNYWTQIGNMWDFSMTNIESNVASVEADSSSEVSDDVNVASDSDDVTFNQSTFYLNSSSTNINSIVSTMSRRVCALKRRHKDQPKLATLDSGAMEHVTPSVNNLAVVTNTYTSSDPCEISLFNASGDEMVISHKGLINEYTHHVLVSTDCQSTLISAPKFQEEGLGIWMPPHTDSFKGAIVYKPCGPNEADVIAITDKNMQYDIHATHKLKLRIPDFSALARVSRMDILRTKTNVITGIARMKMDVSSRVKFAQKTFLYSYDNMLWSAIHWPGFPVNDYEVRKHFCRDLAFAMGHSRQAYTTNRRLHDTTLEDAIDEFNDPTPPASTVPVPHGHTAVACSKLYPKKLKPFDTICSDIYCGTMFIATFDCVATGYSRDSNMILDGKATSKKKYLPEVTKEYLMHLALHGKHHIGSDQPVSHMISDSEAVYKSECMNTLRAANGIIAQFSPPYHKEYSPAEIGIQDKGNYVAAMSALARHMTQSFYPSQWHHANELRNDLPSHVPGHELISRREELYGYKTDLSAVIRMPHGQPLMFYAPKDTRKFKSDRMYPGAYIGSVAQSSTEGTPAAIEVYSFTTRRTVIVEQFEIIAEGLSPLLDMPQKFFTTNAQDLTNPYILKNRAHHTRGKSAALNAQEHNDLTMNNVDLVPIPVPVMPPASAVGDAAAFNASMHASVETIIVDPSPTSSPGTTSAVTPSSALPASPYRITHTDGLISDMFTGDWKHPAIPLKSASRLSKARQITSLRQLLSSVLTTASICSNRSSQSTQVNGEVYARDSYVEDGDEVLASYADATVSSKSDSEIDSDSDGIHVQSSVKRSKQQKKFDKRVTQRILKVQLREEEVLMASRSAEDQQDSIKANLSRLRKQVVVQTVGKHRVCIQKVAPIKPKHNNDLSSFLHEVDNPTVEAAMLRSDAACFAIAMEKQVNLLKRILKKAKVKNRNFDSPSLTEAKKRGDWVQWSIAIQEEFQQMLNDDVHGPAIRGQLPSNANLIGTMWVLKIKRNSSTGEIEKYKARLVALGNQQKESSFDQIKSITARGSTVKMIMAIQAKTGAMSMVLDVKGAYLKSCIQEGSGENLYIRYPDGKIHKLNKYLYGLKQAGFEWQKNVTECLRVNGYVQSTADPMVFTKHEGENFCIMCLHVDDFYVISSKANMLSELHNTLTKAYGTVSIKSESVMAYLGMEVRIESSGDILISQPAYIKAITDLHNISGKKVKTPMRVFPLVVPGDEVRVDQNEYLTLVGALNHLSQYTRPDILFAVSSAAQKCSKPTVGDLKAVVRIFQYLTCTLDLGIRYSAKGSMELVGSVDASHNQYEDGRGHYGYSFSLGRGNGSFDAKSSKMKLNTLSSTESEYVAFCEATREVIWLRRLLADMGFPQIGPTVIYEDNTSTIQMLKGAYNHKASKHVNPRYHFSKSAIMDGEVSVEHLVTTEMESDMLTKPLPTQSHWKFTLKVLNVL